MKVTRKEVYNAIDTERTYQDAKWGHTLSGNRSGNGDRSVDEFALYIEGYARDLANFCSHFANDNQKLEVVRKIAGLGVACMEQHGAPVRQNPPVMES